jgi:hypothetical protein
LIWSISLFGLVFAAPDHFDIEVRPNPMSVNQPADIIIKILDKDGIVVKDYQQDIFIESETDKLSDSEVEFPWWWIYQFQPTDQWNKIFSKWFIVKKEWTFKIIVTDILKQDIRWETTVVVKKDWGWNASGYITVISPVADSIESDSSLHIYGKSELQNSPLEFYLDGTKIKDTKTSNNGDFSIYLNDISSGVHLLQLKIKDLNNNLIGSSDEIKFTYLGHSKSLYQSLELLPANIVTVGTKVTALLKTATTVTIAELIFPDAKKIIFEKVWPGEFKKDFLADKDGLYWLTVKLTTDMDKNQYDNVQTLTVLPLALLGPIKAMRAQADPTQIDLSWTYSGQISQFKVLYGLASDSLDLEISTPTPSLTIPQTDTSKIYYFKIYPQDWNGNDIWWASNIVQVWPIVQTKTTTPICVIDNIQLNSKKIWDKYYIYRNAAPGAIKYNVYRSETKFEDLTDMIKVGETIQTKFEYPFDPKAEKELYAYYRIEGICADNQTTKLSNVKQVKVWPKENIVMLMIIGLIVYSMFQLKMIKRT